MKPLFEFSLLSKWFINHVNAHSIRIHCTRPTHRCLSQYKFSPAILCMPQSAQIQDVPSVLSEMHYGFGSELWMRQSHGKGMLPLKWIAFGALIGFPWWWSIVVGPDADSGRPCRVNQRFIHNHFWWMCHVRPEIRLCREWPWHFSSTPQIVCLN